MRFLPALVAILFAATAFGAVADEKKCTLCDIHKRAQAKGPVPYNGPLVCIRGEVDGPAKVTVHFIGPDGKPYRRDEDGKARPHTGIFNGKWEMKVGRHWFLRVKREGGIVRVCAGEGEIGARFEEINVEEHLTKGAQCESAPVCLHPGLDCTLKW